MPDVTTVHVVNVDRGRDWAGEGGVEVPVRVSVSVRCGCVGEVNGVGCNVEKWWGGRPSLGDKTVKINNKIIV